MLPLMQLPGTRTNPDYESVYRSGTSFGDFIRSAIAQRAQWEAFAYRAPLVEDAVTKIRLAGGCWRLLVLADDWCGDAVNILPVIARLAAALPNLELRIVPRDRYPEIRDRYLTNGTRSIPIVILLDGRGRPRGHWGPRPPELQRHFELELRDLPSEERYRKVRRWYAVDRGRSIAHELADLIERSAAATPALELASGPCHGEQAA
jgi:thioredoxin family protein